MRCPALPPWQQLFRAREQEGREASGFCVVSSRPRLQGPSETNNSGGSGRKETAPPPPVRPCPGEDSNISSFEMEYRF